MKLLLVVVGLFVAAAAGAVGSVLFAPTPRSTAASVEPSRVEPAVIAKLPASAEARIQELAMDVADLEAQVRELRTAAARSTAVVPEAIERSLASSGTTTAVQREQILRVIADEKAAEERRREEERQKREEEARLQRANRMAQRFGLNQAQERQLADFYLASRTKLDEMRESMRTARESGLFDGEQMRATMRDTRDWANAELERLFGPELGRQIGETEMDRFRGGWGQEGGPDAGGGRQGRRGGQGGGGPGGGAPGG